MSLLFQITAEKATRLDILISNLAKDMSRAKIQSLIKSGMILVNNEKCTSKSEIINGKCKIEILTDDASKTNENESNSEIIPIEKPLKIHYEDEHIAIIEKPSGISVHFGAGNDEIALINVLKHHFKNLSTIDESRPGIVHRLDKDTTGLLIIAKTNIAHEKLVQMFKEKKINKEYIAFTWGIPKNAKFSIKTLIGRNPKNRQKMAVVEKNGKEAISNFSILKQFKNVAAKILCNIETGRTHQIRVHLAYNKTPIIGDQVYTRHKTLKNHEQFFNNFKRQALHSRKIEFDHPITNQKISITSELPDDLKTLEKILENI